MIKNVGSVDRLIRIAVAVVIFSMIAAETLHGALAWILGVGAVILVATSTVGMCPLYLPFGISTRRNA